MIETGTPEFSRSLTIAEAQRQRDPMTVTADEAERKALARRFGFAALDALEATVTLTEDAQGIVAEGRLTADVTQTCVATGDPLQSKIHEPFLIRFVPEPAEGDIPDDEIELAADDCDVMHYEGGSIDIGEAAAQTLLLSLEPYPRGSNAADFLKAKGVKSEEEAGAFGALAALKGKLAKK